MEIETKKSKNVRFQSASNVVRVLVTAGGIDLAAVVLLIKDLFGMLLGFLRGVGVVQVCLMAA